MDKEFLKISGEDIKHGKVAIDVFEDKEKTFKAMAEEMVNIIVDHNSRNE